MLSLCFSLILFLFAKVNHSFLPIAQNPTNLYKDRRKELRVQTAKDVLVDGGKHVKDYRSSTTIPQNTNNQLTAYQLLYPYLFSQHKTGDDIARPLQAVMKIIEKALKRIPETDMDLVLDGQQDMIKVIRIEHAVTHSVDPLCWLHAQQQTTIAKNKATVYFSNMKRSMEAAAIGAAHLHRRVSNEEFWNFIRVELPLASHIYGGERFDPGMIPGDEWKEFGSGFWILPTVELRLQNGKTTFAVHVVRENERQSWSEAAQATLNLLTKLSATTSEASPTTTLPPIISRDGIYESDLDTQDVFEHGVTSALEELSNDACSLEKVVLARRLRLLFDKSAELSGLDILRKWKFGGNEGGHLLFLRPEDGNGKEFFGCTPEQLFSVSNGNVTTEALAGTRPRGSNQESDEALSRELFESSKDRSENEITGRFIRRQLKEAVDSGLLVNSDCLSSVNSTAADQYFLRRLLHLQHICQRFECELEDGIQGCDVAEFLLHRLHPTPAVCGFPKEKAIEFIRAKESVAYDRGFYAGPFGYVGRSEAEITVAIRCGLIDNKQSANSKTSKSNVFVFAGAGIVPGSTVQGEWAETSFKLNVVTTLFPQSPISLLGAANSNVAWATAFIEELIRCGVCQFYVCPGSRSTPFVAAIAKALRTNVGIVAAHSVHDERGAAFRAVGYGKGSGCPAAVITSSGSATANLYPGIVEASMDGIPVLIITADRPYENRDTGANQAVDQIKLYSSSYVRWFRDIPPPTDDIPVSVALSDANHAVKIAVQQRGPVHLNVQFRENLAPDAGEIRNDNRVGSIVKFNGFRFTDVPNFYRWSRGGDQWTRTYTEHQLMNQGMAGNAAREIANLILQSERGIIITGNLRQQTRQDMEVEIDAIADFAQKIGFPIFAGIQSGNLRGRSPAVVPYAEHLLKHPWVSKHIKPDLILQIGHPLISTEIPNMITECIRGTERAESDGVCSHVMIHPHHSEERSDPDFTVTHRVSADIASFLSSTISALETITDTLSASCGSDLATLTLLGRFLASKMPSIINRASSKVTSTVMDGENTTLTLTEPQVILAISDYFNESNTSTPFYISNSMPVRDAEFFLYPENMLGMGPVSVNRGASGIDGIFSSAEGFSEANEAHTMLLIGDLAALHDIGSLHGLSKTQTNSMKRSPPLTSIVVNNDGGGIFSFLPIARHGTDVQFEEFWGTPTNCFSFERAAEAFGVSYRSAGSWDNFKTALDTSLFQEDSTIVEAKVVERDVNVKVHKEITAQTNEYISAFLDGTSERKQIHQRLPIKVFSSNDLKSTGGNFDKTLLLIHGWMGDKTEWTETALVLTKLMPSNWSIVAIDLCGHGEAPHIVQELQKMQQLVSSQDQKLSDEFTIDSVAQSVMNSLAVDHGIDKIHAVAGYSLGGRVAMAMNRLCQVKEYNGPKLVTNETKIILLSSNPGLIPGPSEVDTLALSKEADKERNKRMKIDHKIATRMRNLSKRGNLCRSKSSYDHVLWNEFLDSWYNNPIWGDLKIRNPCSYRKMIEKRVNSICSRAEDLALILEGCSPAVNTNLEWKFIKPCNLLVINGELDEKYSKLSNAWKQMQEDLRTVSAKNAGHAVLTETPNFIAEQITGFLISRKESRASPSTRDEIKVEPEVAMGNQLSAVDDKGKLKTSKTPLLELLGRDRPTSLDFEPFSLDLINNSRNEKGVVGIGWGNEASSKEQNRLNKRKGFILQVSSADGVIVGLGEVSPLKGVHEENFHNVEEELKNLKRKIESNNSIPTVDAAAVLSLEGDLKLYINELLEIAGVKSLSPSVMSGLEMAILAFASQMQKKPVLSCLSEFVANTLSVPLMLPLSGIRARSTSDKISKFKNGMDQSITYNSLKVKVGHQDIEDDVESLSIAYQQSKRLRPDANRAWTEGEALNFSHSIQNLTINLHGCIEFVEEPIKKVTESWSLSEQMLALERWFNLTRIKYGLDESIVDLLDMHKGDFDAMKNDMITSFTGIKGCAAIVLKPSRLGVELSMRLSKFAHKELGVSVVFSSSFDSGIGLSYAAFLSATSNLISGLPPEKLLAHGIGTFSMLNGDTLCPSFASYVNTQGILQVSSLSRALFGLCLDEMRGSSPPRLPDEMPTRRDGTYKALTASSTSGREISVVASLLLPFSDDVACTRFADLPQASRWSPWLSSVAYLDAGRESEWTLNVRGVKFSWRAVSDILKKPYKGIRWESVSGLKNMGIVEFEPLDESTCIMKVRMTLIAPRILATLFPGASVFLEKFLQDKLIKWSLEMFRDVVKGDLALEKGDVELGDALFSAAEGKASAIEATLSIPTISTGGEDQ